MAFDLCVIPVSTVPYLSALQTRQFSMTEITAHLVSGKLTREQCRSMTPETFSASYGSSSHALQVRSSVSSEINLSLTSSANENAPTGYSVVIQGYLVSQEQQVVLGVCVSDEPIVADTSLRLFVNIEETNNVFRLSADFDGMVTQGLLDDILETYVTTDTAQDITGEKTFTESGLKIGSDTVKHYSLKHGQEFIIGTQTAATNEWTGVSVQDALYDGMCINFYLPYAGNSTAATLTLTMADGTTTAAIPIKYRGNNNVTTTFPVGSIIQLTYCENKVIGTGTITGWLADSNYATPSPTVSYERNRIGGRVIAGSTGLYALQPSLLVDRDGNKYVSITTSSTAHASVTPKTCTSLGFYPESILTSDTSYASGSTAATNKIWRTYTLTVNQCFGTASLTASRPVYLVCTFNRNDGKFYLDTTQWWAQTIPQQENGKLYIFLGITATTTTFTLDAIHPILCYKDGRVQEVTYASLVTDDRIDALEESIPQNLSDLEDDLGVLTEHQSLAAYPTSASYNSSTKKITFTNASNTALPNMEIDATDFIKDGMVSDVAIQNDNLVVSFNTDAGKEDISIPLSSIFDPTNYYTKTQTDTQISNAIDALGDAAEYDVDPFPITDASSGNLVTTISMTQWVRSQNYAKMTDLPTVNNAALTIQKNGATVATFTANASSGVTADISVPENTSDLENDSGFVSESDLGSAAFRDAVDVMPDASSGDLPSSVAIKSWVNGAIQDKADYIQSLIPSVYNATLTIKKNANDSGDTFTANASSNKTINLGLGAAADKSVDTSIVNASSGNLPTVEAVTGWVSSQLGGYAQSSDIPTVGNATITIQKRSGTSAGNFTTNATANKTINLSLGAAADKAVDTSISNTSSTNLPTTSAVVDWVNAQGFLTSATTSSNFVVANFSTQSPSGLSNVTDYRPARVNNSDNPHYGNNDLSFKIDATEVPSNGTSYDVYINLSIYVGSVQVACNGNNYLYPIYFRGNDNVHCPTIPAGSVLRMTLYNNAFYCDFYDLADFGKEHEAYVYVGKVPIDRVGSALDGFSGLVGMDETSGKFSQLFTVDVTANGAFVQSPRLKENSPIYACFQGNCFAAHPKVPFGNILRIHDEYYVRDELQTGMLPFMFYPFTNNDTVAAHVVVNPSSEEGYSYFHMDNCPVYILPDTNRVVLGNVPEELHARLIGFLCEGANNAGMLRLVDNDPVSFVTEEDYAKTYAGEWYYDKVDQSSSTYSAYDEFESLDANTNNILVGVSKTDGRLVPFLRPDACGGGPILNPQLNWDAPIYVMFEGFKCYSAYPYVNFKAILYSGNSGIGTFYNMSYVLSGTDSQSYTSLGDDGENYWAYRDYPVFVSDYSHPYNSSECFCIGIPKDIQKPSGNLRWRLLGYTTDRPGYIRLTQDHPYLKDFINRTSHVNLSDYTSTFYDASIGSNVTPSAYVNYFMNSGLSLQQAVQALIENYGEEVFKTSYYDGSTVYYCSTDSDNNIIVYFPEATNILFGKRLSFRLDQRDYNGYYAEEVAFIDENGVYHGNATGLTTTPSLSFSSATSGTAGGTLTVTVGGRTSSSVAISPVRRARQPYVIASASDGSYPLVFTNSVSTNYKDLYTDTVNSLYYNPSSNILSCPTFSGNLTGTASKATADASGNTITSYYCTLSTAQTISGSKVFTGNITVPTDFITVGTTSRSFRVWINTGTGGFNSSTGSFNIPTSASIGNVDNWAKLRQIVSGIISRPDGTVSNSTDSSHGIGSIRIAAMYRVTANTSAQFDTNLYNGFLVGGANLRQIALYSSAQDVKCQYVSKTLSTGSWVCLMPLTNNSMASSTASYPIGLFVRIA